MPVITQDILSSVLKPTASGWVAEGLKDITFKGVTFKAAGEGPALRLTKAERVTLEGCRFEGDAQTPAGIGLEVVGADKLIIRGKCEFVGLATGAKLVDGTGLIVDANSFHHIRADGLIYSGQVDYLIQKNEFRDFMPVGLKHPDAIQAVRPGPYNRPSARGRIIANTVIVRKAQGIFVPETIDTLIADNFICTDLGTAIGVTKTLNARLRNNAIATFGPSDTVARIDGREAVGLVYETAHAPMTYLSRAAPKYAASV